MLVDADGTRLHVVAVYPDGDGDTRDLLVPQHGRATIVLGLPPVRRCVRGHARVYVTAEARTHALTRATTFVIRCPRR